MTQTQNEQDTQTALFIGRFQPFHNGHRNAVEAAREAFDLVLAIGSAQTSHTPDNPLSLDERQRVIGNCFPDLPTHGVPDFADDDEWFAYLQENIDFDIGISGNDHVRRIFNDHGVEIRHPDYLDIDYYSGTAIRELVVNDEPWRERVPDCSLDALDEIGFVDRIRTVAARTDPE